MTGTLLATRYRIGRLLGEGGMGAIYEAEDITTGGTVVVKVIHHEMRGREVFVRRFAREAIAAAVASPHICAVLDTGIDDATQTPFLVMARLHGEDLGSLLRRVRMLSVDLAVRIAIQISAGLEAAHAAGVVHRDIKPSNLMLARGANGDITVTILDFGIAKLRGGDGADLASSLTQTGAVIGSPYYMSPEQARGGDQVDDRADLWSLGVVLYQALCGRPPHEASDGVGGVIVAICTQPAPLIQDLAPWVPAPVALVVHKTLALRRESRYQTAGELRAALTALVRDTTIHESELIAISEAERLVVADRMRLTDESTLVHAPERAARSSSGPNRGTRILVVEDNELNMDMLSRRLEKKGYTVLKAFTGEEGLVLAVAETPDLILMDIGLPGNDGLDVVRTLRDAQDTQQIPIIALTARATAADRDQALEAGCNEYETKPVDLPRLLAKITALLSRP